MPNSTPARLSFPCPRCRVLLSPRIDEAKLARLGAIVKCHRCGFRIDLVAWLRDRGTGTGHDAAEQVPRRRSSSRPPQPWRPLWVTQRPQSGVRKATDAQAADAQATDAQAADAQVADAQVADAQLRKTQPYDFAG